MKTFLAILLVALPVLGWAASPTLGSPSYNNVTANTLNSAATISGTQSPAGPFTVNLQGPCDIASNAGTPCVAAHSVTRRLLGSYSGPIFNLTRASDGTNQDVSTVAEGTWNASTVSTFGLATSLYFSKIYDQSGNGNVLPQATLANMAPWMIDPATGLPFVSTSGNAAYFRNRTGTSNLPSGTAPATIYEIRRIDMFSACCGEYGLMENSITSVTAGNMLTDAYDNYTGNLINGVLGFGIDVEGNVPSFATSGTPTLVMEVAKLLSNGQYQICVWNAQTGSVVVPCQAFSLPIAPTVQNGISLGEGGDASTNPAEFLEGFILNGASSSTTDAAILKNVVTFYGSQAPNYVGPVDLMLNAGCSGALCTAYTTGGANTTVRPYFATIGGAWGLRKMTSGYTGYSALIRRNSDNTTLNIGFDQFGNFDDATAKAFCSATIGTATGSITAGALTVTGGAGNIAVGDTLGYALLGTYLLPGTIVTSGSGSSWTVSPSQTIVSVNFTVYPTCYVARLYNQSITRQGAAGSNGNDTGGGIFDLVAPSTATQPQLVFGDLNGRDALRSLGSQYMCNPSITYISTYGPAWMFGAVAKRTGNTGAVTYAISSNGNTGIEFPASVNTAGTNPGNGGTVTTATANDNAWNELIGYLNVSGNPSFQVNGGTVASNSSTAMFFAQNFVCILSNSYTTNNGTTWNAQGVATADWAEGWMGVGFGGVALSTSQLSAIYQNEHAYYGGQF